MMAHGRTRDRSRRLATGRPPAVRFWYRQGTSYLLPENRFVSHPLASDPPITDRGMVTVFIDTRGRLERFLEVPPERDGAADAGADPDAGVLFKEAGLDPAAMKAVEPQWTPAVFADHRMAWEGRYPEVPDVQLHIEAASYRGRWVSFGIGYPWTTPTGSESAPPSLLVRVSSAAISVIVLTVLAGGFLVARRNIRLGRGDRKGTIRLVSAVFLVGASASLLSMHYIPAPAVIGRIIYSAAFPLIVAVAVGIFYLALEPYLRRIWPRMIVSWVRLLDGRFSDALVGRDVLVGLVVGAAMRLLDQSYQLLAQRFGLEVQVSDQLTGLPLDQTLFGYTGAREAVANLLAFVVAALLFPLGATTLLLLFRVLLRRRALAIVAFLLIVAPTGLQPGIDPIGFLTWSLIGSVLILFVIFRFGLLTFIVGVFVDQILASFPMTLSTSAWYFGRTLMVFLLLAAIAVYGYRVTVGPRPSHA